MPHKIIGPCTFPRCNQRSVRKGRCAAHPPKEHKGGGLLHRRERRAMYATAFWKATRRLHLQAHPYCATCGKPAQCVDHITPHRGGEDLFRGGGLQSLCNSCHSSKTIAEQIEAGTQGEAAHRRDTWKR